MGTVHVTAETHLPPERVLAAARDFSERRADRWPDVHVEHLHVHELGETFAEVTEGNPSEVGFMWERLRYDWSQPGSVKATVVVSNLFHPGSTWELRARPSNGGSVVEIIGIRHTKGMKGLYIAAAIRLGLAKRVVADHLRHFLRTLEDEAAGSR